MNKKYFIEISPKLEYGLYPITKMATKKLEYGLNSIIKMAAKMAATCQFALVGTLTYSLVTQFLSKIFLYTFYFNQTLVQV